jgi:hypothetical protein
MDDTDRKIAEHDDMIRDLVANDPLFKVFAVVEEDTQKGRRFILVKRESGAGIQIPDPGSR